MAAKCPSGDCLAVASIGELVGKTDQPARAILSELGVALHIRFRYRLWLSSGSLGVVGSKGHRTSQHPTS